MRKLKQTKSAGIEDPENAEYEMKTTQQQNLVGYEAPSRREFLARSVVAGAAILLCPSQA